ncbi:MAG TPA: class GN sortase [Thermoanaerobaculia bacterium]|nr:class GN sortase [Thermoanaerobaculia bacterium]
MTALARWRHGLGAGMRGHVLVGAAVALLSVSGLMLAVKAAWIPAKAQVAQVLLARAWSAAEAGEARPRPWPWADTWPVARLTLPGGESLIVLAGASGRTLAFGPGHLDGTARPGDDGNVVVAGHRDTHFRPLAGLAPGEELVLESPGGDLRRYAVVAAEVVDEHDVRSLAPSDDDRLTLVTCWPFDAVEAGGPLRYVVTAVATVPGGRPARRAAGGFSSPPPHENVVPVGPLPRVGAFGPAHAPVGRA